VWGPPRQARQRGGKNVPRTFDALLDTKTGLVEFIISPPTSQLMVAVRTCYTDRQGNMAVSIARQHSQTVWNRLVHLGYNPVDELNDVDDDAPSPTARPSSPEPTKVTAAAAAAADPAPAKAAATDSGDVFTKAAEMERLQRHAHSGDSK